MSRKAKARPEDPRLPTADRKMVTHAILSAPVNSAAVEHLPMRPSQRYGPLVTLCGRTDVHWQERSDVRFIIRFDGQMPLCSKCARVAEDAFDRRAL